MTRPGQWLRRVTRHSFFICLGRRIMHEIAGDFRADSGWADQRSHGLSEQIERRWKKNRGDLAAWTVR